jgi:tRNA (guanine37-N1)-methyltransferase
MSSLNLARMKSYLTYITRMRYQVFTLHPQIFDSFLDTSFMARGIKEELIQVDRVNWREDFGVGSYKQVDDNLYGGGHGMVLQAEPIFQALQAASAISDFFEPPLSPTVHQRKRLPNRERLSTIIQQKNTAKITISLTPRGWTLDQTMVQFLSHFETINILCGRYEGFDARVSEAVDMEISLGDFVLNGGEVAAMSLMESISRFVPGFIPKFDSVLHDSFSPQSNVYSEQWEYTTGKHNHIASPIVDRNSWWNEFDRQLDTYEANWHKKAFLLEHPQYTRPLHWHNWSVPEVLTSGDHRRIQKWRTEWQDPAKH